MGDCGLRGQATPAFVALSPWPRHWTAFWILFGEDRAPLTHAATPDAAWRADLATIVLQIMATLGVFCSTRTLTCAVFEGTDLFNTPRALRTTVAWSWGSLLSVGKVASKSSKVENQRNQCNLEAVSAKTIYRRTVASYRRKPTWGSLVSMRPIHNTNSRYAVRTSKIWPDFVGFRGQKFAIGIDLVLQP